MESHIILNIIRYTKNACYEHKHTHTVIHIRDSIGTLIILAGKRRDGMQFSGLCERFVFSSSTHMIFCDTGIHKNTNFKLYVFKKLTCSFNYNAHVR